MTRNSSDCFTFVRRKCDSLKIPSMQCTKCVTNAINANQSSHPMERPLRYVAINRSPVTTAHIGMVATQKTYMAPLVGSLMRPGSSMGMASGGGMEPIAKTARYRTTLLGCW